MCGFFAFFSGFMYNDFLAIPLSIFGTCFDENLQKVDRNCVVPVGIDPLWHQGENFLSYINSFKMKFSIIIAVAQINLGLIFALFNYVHFDDWVTIIFTGIPRFIFYNAIFGYMMFLIIVKWLTPFDDRTPPSIIGIFISGGPVTENTYLWGSPDGSDQTWFQAYAALTVLLLIPWMVIPEPIIHYFHQPAFHKNKKHTSESEPLMEDENDTGKHHEVEVVPIGEFFIHHGIEVVEFVIECISKTASYLR